MICGKVSVLLFGLVLASNLGSDAYGMYNPGLGRFCSRDPIGYMGSEWGLNDFGDSNPFNSLDPTGLIIAKTGPHGGGLYGGCETLTTIKTEIVCKYFKLGWWSLWEKEIRFPYASGIDATKLCRSNTPSKWVFERVGYERTTTTTTWCRSCSPVAVGLCKPSFKVGPVECVITATVVVGKIYLDNQPEVDEKKEPWYPDQDPEEDCIFTGRWAPADFCEYECKSGFKFTTFPNMHQEWACERFAKPKEAQK
jgi:hypothetical protein